MKEQTITTLCTKTSDTGVRYKGKTYRVQERKGWKFIQVKEGGKRKLIGVSTIEKEETLLDSLNTVEGWEALYQQQLLT